MKIENILEAAKSWNPVKVLTTPDEEYLTLKEGEVVVDFNDELMMSYDGKEPGRSLMETGSGITKTRCLL